MIDDDLTRRALVRRLGMSLGAWPLARLLAACGDNSSASVDATADARADAAAIDASSATGDGACSETLEGEIGPYFADDSADGFARSNVLSNLDGSDAQPGIPLALTIHIYDSEKACAPLAGAQVDIWHCNASGVYSDIAGEGTTGQQWLRGYQISDANGMVSFATILPGWYAGRTTHIHARIRSAYSEASSTSDGTNTTQMFFAQALVDMISTTIAPYASEGVNPTTNASDRVYAEQTAGQNELTLVGSVAAGYAATFAIYLPIDDAAGSGSGPGSGGPGSGSGMGPPPP